MTVYVDALRDYGEIVTGPARRHGTRWSHILADSEIELRAFAVSIGLREDWIQHAGTRRAHYDVTPSRRARAVAAGAVEREIREIIRERMAVDG